MPADTPAARMLRAAELLERLAGAATKGPWTCRIAGTGIRGSQPYAFVMSSNGAPACGSPAPHLHPAVQAEGEVQPCRHPWHTPDGARPDAVPTREG